MLAKVKSPELIEVFAKDETIRDVFHYDAGTNTAYVSINNVMLVLDHSGLQLKLARYGGTLYIETAGVQEV